MAASQDPKLAGVEAQSLRTDVIPDPDQPPDRGGLWGHVATALAVFAGLLHLYTGLFGVFSASVQRAAHWGLLAALVFFIYPARRQRKTGVTVFDLVLVAGVAVATIYLLANWQNRLLRVFMPSPQELVMGTMMIVITLEAARRTAGWFLSLTALIFLVYAQLGPYLPGILRHRGYSLSRVVSFLYSTTEGIFGTPIGISATFIILFILFGAFLNESGGGKFFIDLAYAVAGRFRGGAAKTSVISSALMGTISGSPIANAVTTGTFTIPLMRRNGYPNHVACAVEAAASTGGMIMPPVMGAAAFIMAEYLRVTYTDVAIAAAIPAVLYFVAVFLMVDFEAQRRGIVSLPSESLPDVRKTLRQGGHLLIPLAALIYFLLDRWSPMKAVVWSTLILVAVSWLRRETRLDLPRVLRALDTGVRNAAPVATACAAAGIILGIVSMTGLGVTFSSSLLELSRGNLLLALVITMVASLILGMGLPATAVYLVLATLAAPALESMGVQPIAAHMFVFYFGIISTITPPVALTAYAAAGIGGANPARVGWSAFGLGIVGYIVPFMFVYSPSLLMVGTTWKILGSVVTALLGVYCIAASVTGYLKGRIGVVARTALFIAGLFLIRPGLVTDAVGIGLLALAWLIGDRFGPGQAVAGGPSR
ncbi:TRAP transporter permease [Limnochorda pilosa]|uniref:C4-dicarboxylate ABC transporter n=1 Tax=Limnochorda pilosa TaxID=1555112 RepID=A0A0K2SM91_LIMPI|nr:TRAP transporter permease [Limnochorda pilosa]BAS28231.1 C4-dicarboxylate ABC transporter [Limnochorda pilosa]